MTRPDEIFIKHVTVSKPSARQKFVEAMRGVLAHYANGVCDGCMEKVRQACEAFTDAVCEETPQDEKMHHADHHACRAALIKEVGLGE